MTKSPKSNNSADHRPKMPAEPILERRLHWVDALRGCAILLMFIYHFCFDLNYFGVLRQDFNHDIRWLGFRTVILSSFLTLVGVGIALGHGDKIRWPAFWKRWLQIAGGALLVTIGTYAMFPRSYVYFGVLHHIALASVIALAFVRVPKLVLALGIALLAIGNFVSHPYFDQPWLNWFGLMTHKPITEDYVPLLPWFGMVLIGVAIGCWIKGRAPLKHWRAGSSSAKVLVWGGRHSLILYLIHQPIFVGLLSLLLAKSATN